LPSLQPLEELPGGGLLVEVVGGDHDGELLVLVSERRGTRCRRATDLLGPCEIGDDVRATLALVEGDRGGSFREVARGPGRVRARRPSATQSRSASSRTAARWLLESLLDEVQLASWRDHGRFEVPVPDGTVELGELYNLHYRRRDGREFALCVVPRSYASLPLDDIWTNLLLMLRSDPERFFGVANYREYCSFAGWHSGPVPRA
jgi:hypothetical protein